MLLLVSSALALPAPARVEGPAVATREDAPTDARVLFHGNFEPSATIWEGTGAPDTVLPVEMLVANTMGNDPLVAVLPPSGGWAAGASFILAVDDGDGGLVDFAFGVGDGPADDPIQPEVVDLGLSEWSEEGLYLGGCCEPVRTVTVTVRNPSSDPWSYVELIGDFPGPSELTETALFRHLGAGIGPGEHQISFRQWDQDGELHPTTFTVAAVEADGESSAEVPVDVPGLEVGDPTGCGCQGAPGPSGGLALLAITLAARSRRSSRA